MKRFAAAAAALFALLFAIAAPSIFGQAFTSNLTGLVSDPNGAVMPGVAVKVKNTATNETRQSVTGQEGRFTFSQLLPGAYELTAEAKASSCFHNAASHSLRISPANSTCRCRSAK